MKSMLKKLLVAILVLTLAVSLLSSCGANDANGNEETNETTDTQGVDSTDNPTESTPQESEPEDTEPEDLYDFSGAASPALARIAENIAKSEKYLIFTIGDSVTAGSGASDPIELDYTANFARKLAAVMTDKTVYRVDNKVRPDLLGVKYTNDSRHVLVQESTGGEVIIARCGIGGDTVKRIINRSKDFIEKEIRGQTGNLFIICSGINDYDTRSYAPDRYAAPPVYKEQLNTLIDMIYASHPDADIILMTPTYLGPDGKGLDLYANKMQEISEERGVGLIDLHKLWMDNYDASAENFGQGNWLNSGKNDSCHPSDIGHAAMADEMIRCLFGVN